MTGITLPTQRKQLYIMASIALAVVMFDLVSKQLATVLLATSSAAASPSLLGFHFFLTWNEGTAGGMWLGENTRLINIVSMSFVAVLAAMMLRPLALAHKLAPSALGLIIGAALGNTLSLLVAPGVVDFIAYSGIVFNVADIAAFAGIVTLLPVGLSLAERVYATKRHRVSIPHTAAVHAHAADAVRKTTVFEREVPIAYASEIAKRPVAASYFLPGGLNVSTTASAPADGMRIASTSDSPSTSSLSPE